MQNSVGISGGSEFFCFLPEIPFLDEFGPKI